MVLGEGGLFRISEEPSYRKSDAADPFRVVVLNMFLVDVKRRERVCLRRYISRLGNKWTYTSPGAECLYEREPQPVFINVDTTGAPLS